MTRGDIMSGKTGAVPALGGAAREERSPAAVEVRPVHSRRDLRAFVDFPYALYAGDPAWVAPLKLEQHHQFSPKSAFFQHARVQLWTAYRDGTPVGRISAQVDDLRLQRYADATGHF